MPRWWGSMISPMHHAPDRTPAREGQTHGGAESVERRQRGPQSVGQIVGQSRARAEAVEAGDRSAAAAKGKGSRDS